MKKTIISILIIIVLGGTGTYLYLKKREIPDYNMVNMVSNDAAFFLNIQNARKFLEKLSGKNAIWNELTQIPSIQSTAQQIGVLDSVIRSDHVLKKFFRNRRLIISAEKQGKERIDFTFLIKLDHLREQKHIWQHFQRWGNQDNYRLTSKKYNKVRLSTLHRNEEQYLSFAVMKGILIVSTSPLLVEDAIRQTTVKSTITDDKHFQMVAKTAGKNVAANLYIHLKKFPEIIALPLKQPFESYIKNLSKFARWSALDVNLKSEALLLNGFTVQNKEQSEIIDLFRQQEPVDLEIENILPSNTAAFITLGISNKADYRKELEKLYREQDVLDDYSVWIEHIENKHGFNPRDVFYNLLHQEIGMAFLNATTQNPKDKAFVIVKTKGQKYARSQLSGIIHDNTSASIKKQHIQNITIDESTSYPVYQLPVDDLFSNLFGSLFQGLSNRYFTFIDKYAVFAGSPDLLKEFIYSNILNKTLKNNHLYHDFSDHLSSQSNFHFYANMYRSSQLISSFLREDLQEGLKDNFDHLRKFQGIAFQFLNSEDMVYNNLFVQYIPEINNKPKTLWETHLDTTIDFKPAFVKNHYTGENEIFVQDLNNKIYLINDVGRILWEKQLKEQIMSEIYQIDFYRNGKLQMLFNTQNKLHLIARNGNYVEKYPVHLPSPASAPLSVFDYENNKNYRIFVPCDNKRVYDFSKEGDIITGWAFDKTDTRITQRVQYFRIKDRDYIVFADKYQIYILNRRGLERVRAEKQFARSKNNLFTLEPENSRTRPRLVTTDINGTIHYVYFNGEVSTKEIHTFSPGHHFDYEDVDSDGLKDFIFIDDNKMEVYSANGQKLFEHAFKANISGPPIYFHFSENDRKLGVVSRQENRIFLLNQNGKIQKGFPLEGNTPFTIGYLEKTENNFNLIVGNQFNFLYNYKVVNHE